MKLSELSPAEGSEQMTTGGVVPIAVCADERIDLQPLFPTPPADAQADEAAFSLMTARAVGELRAAMALHDELETYYTAAMDFDRWQERLEQILADVLPR